MKLLKKKLSKLKTTSSENFLLLFLFADSKSSQKQVRDNVLKIGC